MNQVDETTTCLFPTCERTQIYARGLCQTCYAAAAQLVSRGKTTWDDLEESGKVLPKRRGVYHPRQQWFLGDLSAAELADKVL